MLCVAYRKGHVLCIAQYGYNQASGRGDGYRDIDIVAVHDLIGAVVDEAVHCWELEQGGCTGLQ